MVEPLCAGCLMHDRGAVPAAAFVRKKRWSLEDREFVDAGSVVPICKACFDRRWAMTQPDAESAILWEDGLKMWELQQVHES